MKSINRESLSYVNAVEGARAYLLERCSKQLLQVCVVGRGAAVGPNSYNSKIGCTLIAVYVEDIVDNLDALYALFRVHSNMSKSCDRPARLIRNDLIDAGVDRNRIMCKYLDVDYNNIEKDKHGVAATPIERIACEWLDYKWTGALNHSALYEHETGARLGRKGGRAVPDGIRENGDALEVKCIRGRTTYISDCK